MNGIGKTHGPTGYLKEGPNPSTLSSLKRVRSQEDPFVYDPMPSGDDGDQPKEDNNRAKSYVSTLFVVILNFPSCMKNIEH